MISHQIGEGSYSTVVAESFSTSLRAIKKVISSTPRFPSTIPTRLDSHSTNPQSSKPVITQTSSDSIATTPTNPKESTASRCSISVEATSKE